MLFSNRLSTLMNAKNNKAFLFFERFAVGSFSNHQRSISDHQRFLFFPYFFQTAYPRS